MPRAVLPGFHDSLEVPPAKLRDVRVLVRLLDGRPVYRDPGFTQL